MGVQATSSGVAMAIERCETYRVSPSDDRCAKLRRFFDYFQYKAPGVDSPLASCIDEDVDQKSMVRELARLAKVKAEDIVICDRRTFRICLKTLEEIDFAKPYIYCHKRVSEGQLECLLRHCRNALAHGNVFVKFLKNDTRICLQDLDVDGRSKKKSASALIVINKASLERWMKLIKECEVQS